MRNLTTKPLRTSTLRTSTLAVLPLVAALALSGCATDEVASQPGTTTGASTIDNCGFEQKFTAAPKKIVTIKSTSTELAVALGLQDKIVGSAFNDGPVVDVRSGKTVEVPVISEQAPDEEAVLAAEPDLVFAGWESNLAADTAGERATLAKLGVQTYVSPAACQEPAYQPKPMTFDKLWAQFAEAGKVLGAEDAAASLVKSQKSELAKAAPARTGTTALWWSSGDDIPFVGGGIGAPQMVMEAVGLTNINAKNPKTWDSLGWEAIVAADPDVIVLVDAVWNPAAAKIKTLTTNAATKNMSAVKNKRFLTIPFPAAEAGVRSVKAVNDLSAQLGTLDLLAP